MEVYLGLILYVSIANYLMIRSLFYSIQPSWINVEWKRKRWVSIKAIICYTAWPAAILVELTLPRICRVYLARKDQRDLVFADKVDPDLIKSQFIEPEVYK